MQPTAHDHQDERTLLERFVAHLLSWTGLIVGLVLILASVLAHIAQARDQPDGTYVSLNVIALMAGEIGAVMFAFALLHVTYDRYTRRSWMAGIKEAVREEGTFSDLGMKCARRRLSDTDVGDLLRRARRIRILKTWFPEANDMLHAFEEAVAHAEDIEILLCDPESHILRVRSEGVGEDPNVGAEWVRRTLRMFGKACATKPSARFRIGLYDAWPGCPIIWADDRILLGFYFRGRSSPSAPWIEVWPGSELAQILDGQFTSLWSLKNTTRITTCQELAPYVGSAHAS